jgi:hypothetical protein
LFNTAYGVVKAGKLFSDYELICEIQVKNGLDLGENYRNINGCKTFAASIAQTLVAKQVKFQILSYKLGLGKSLTGLGLKKFKKPWAWACPKMFSTPEFITIFYQFLHIRIEIIYGSHMYIFFLPRVSLYVSFLPLANARGKTS